MRTADLGTRGGGRALTRRRIALAAVIAVAAAATVGFVVFGNGTAARQGLGGPALMKATCSSVANQTSSTVQHVADGGDGGHAYFLIVAADPSSPFAGFNGSYYVGTSAQWPTMYVHVGQTVSFHVINCQSHEPHGFAVSYYADSTIASIQPGQSYDLTFTATKAGTFKVYCDVWCAIHAFMQNGALVVR